MFLRLFTSFTLGVAFFIAFGNSAVAGSLIGLPLVEVDALRPTQAVAGYDEVARKARKISELSKIERKEYFLKNAIPVVVGPDSQLYMIDHHHFLLAAYQKGYEMVYYKLVADFSDSGSMEQFWKRMLDRGWVYLKSNGRPITPADLPKHIRRLKNDRFRSLAGQIRKNGGYYKTGIPYAEFFWADFFRERIPLEILLHDKKRAFQMAMDLTVSPDAKNLPGYKKSGLCIKFYGQ